MILINYYKQFIAELVNTAKQEAGIQGSLTTKLAITESQLINMLKDIPGIVIAGNIPGADFSKDGFFRSDGECLLMVLEKMPEDKQGTESECERLSVLQKLMLEIVKLLLNYDGFDRFCDKGDIDYSRPLRVEWEYNTYGGFNGLSLTFRLKDKNV